MAASDGWSIIESPFRIEHFKAYEGLFTLGSGYLHVRGSLEEHLSDAQQNVTYTRLPANVTSEKFRETKSKWGTYVPGIFGRHPLLNNEMINLPWFLGMAPIVDGERLDVEKCRIEDYRRELRLDTATLVRTLRWRTVSGATIDLKWERFVSAARPHLCVQRMWIATDTHAELVLRAGIDADVRTNGHDHFAEVGFSFLGEANMLCLLRTDAGDEVTIATQLNGPVEATWKSEKTQRQGELVGRCTLRPGPPAVFDKRTVVATSRDEAHLEPVELTMEGTRDVTYGHLHAEHAEVWRKRWQTCDVIIEGDPESQLAVRLSLYHLLRAHVPGDSRVAIDAKGYAGEAYWGRYFWDTEVYLLPFFLYTDPQKARTLVDYRVQSLPGAKANAARYGYPGARYAWESDADGRECCPNWQYADHEVHVTADVVYGLVHYAAATESPDYLVYDAAGVLLETSRYWLARLDQREGDDRLSLLGVMGPDEYTPISSNNSYTNRMVSFALKAAAQLGPAPGRPVEECRRFADAAEKIPILYDERRQLVLQCEEFDRLAEPQFEKYWKDRSMTFASQVSQERLYRSKCLKQADVLMLMMLFPEEFTDEQVRRAWDYYLPYTTHDSSLSAGVHCIIAARLGLAEEAWRFWQMGKAIDLDVERGGAAEGIHIANAGAVWQMAVFGFAGMRTALQAQRLTLAPRLPKTWSRLAVPLVWKGRPAYVDIRPEAVRVTNHGKGPLEVSVHGEVRSVGTGASEVWASRP